MDGPPVPGGRRIRRPRRPRHGGVRCGGRHLRRAECLDAASGLAGLARTLGDMAKPLEAWTPDELRLEIGRLAEELARRSAVPAAATGKSRGVDVVRACENWVRGLAWDETFTQEMVEDELSIHERKAGQELGPLDRERLIQMWLALYAERFTDGVAA